MTLIADIFPKLRTPKDGVRSMSKKSSFRGAFDNQHGNRAQALLKSERQHLYHIYWSLSSQFSLKKSLLGICTVFRLFVNILTADDKYYLLNRDNLTEPIQILLSEKLKTFSQFSSAFLKFRLNFEHFPKRDNPYGWCISKITDSEIRG